MHFGLQIALTVGSSEKRNPPRLRPSQVPKCTPSLHTKASTLTASLALPTRRAKDWLPTHPNAMSRFFSIRCVKLTQLRALSARNPVHSSRFLTILWMLISVTNFNAGRWFLSTLPAEVCAFNFELAKMWVLGKIYAVSSFDTSPYKEFSGHVPPLVSLTQPRGNFELGALIPAVSPVQL